MAEVYIPANSPLAFEILCRAGNQPAQADGMDGYLQDPAHAFSDDRPERQVVVSETELGRVFEAKVLERPVQVLVPLAERPIRRDRRRLPPVMADGDHLEHQVGLRLAQADVPDFVD